MYNMVEHSEPAIPAVANVGVILPTQEYPENSQYTYLPYNTSWNQSWTTDILNANETLTGTKFTLAGAIIIGCIMSLIIFFAIAGNILVVVAILTDGNLRKCSNYFIISLAVADMIVAIMVMSFAVANDIHGYWVFDIKFCSVWMSFDVMASTASILNLCAISLDRYIHIRNPLHYETWMTPLKCALSISAVWILSGLISFLPIHLGWHQLDKSDIPHHQKPTPGEYYICLLELNPLYAVLSSMVSFYLPCIVMITIYVRLYQYARRHVMTIKKTTRTPGNDVPPNNKAASYKVSDHKAAITLGIIMGVFLLCWMPFFTINIIAAFCPSCIPDIVFALFTWLGYSNSTLNPVIYSIFNTEFRNAFKRVLSFPHCQKLKDLDPRRPVRFTHVPLGGSYCSKGKSTANNSPTNEVTCV